MVVNILGIHIIAMLGTEAFWGGEARAPIGG
jgi:phospholipid/cholesterol/gamma-HCH transport system permease protein